MRRATPPWCAKVCCCRISIHALREEGDVYHRFSTPEEEAISIHALREEGDRLLLAAILQIFPISIHALREEGDPVPRLPVCCHQKFLSTPSARRATNGSLGVTGCKVNFYPRPPRGGRREPRQAAEPSEEFLSTPSARRATNLHTRRHRHDRVISIHALREEGDQTRAAISAL